MADPSPVASDQYKGAVDTYRSIIRWLIASLGAIAAALVVGIQLTSLGHLTGTRLIAAIVVAAVGLLAVVAAIAFAITVLVPVAASPEALKNGSRFAELRAISGDDLETMLRGMPVDSIAGFVDLYLEEVRTERRLREELRKLPTDSQEQKTLQTQIDRAAGNLRVYAPVLSSLIGRGLYEHTRKTFHDATMRMFVAAGVVGAAAIAFAYLANPSTSAAAPTQPTITIRPVVDARDARITLEGLDAKGFPTDCAAYVVELDELADDEQQIASHLRSAHVNLLAKSCGVTSEKDLRSLLTYLSKR